MRAWPVRRAAAEARAFAMHRGITVSGVFSFVGGGLVSRCGMGHVMAALALDAS